MSKMIGKKIIKEKKVLKMLL